MFPRKMAMLPSHKIVWEGGHNQLALRDCIKNANLQALQVFLAWKFEK